MNSATRITHFLRASAALLVTTVGLLFSVDDDESLDHHLGDGSDRFGKHNFRTGRMSSGTEPDGWYKEDL